MHGLLADLPGSPSPAAILAARRHEGLIVDNFAGGGGASTGIEQAMGRPIDIAINHDAEAIAMHQANHPATHHLCQSIYAVDPIEAVTVGGVPRPILAAWFSPDCKHFSKAKGGKPVEKNIRDLAWTVVHWVERLGPALQPLVIWLENVEEFRTWGPLTAENKPCPNRKGETFDEWVGRLRHAGYKVEWRELKACDYGAPTSRKRLYMVARCDGKRIVWPEPTHGKPGSPDVLSGRLLPWRTAAEIIDWSIPCPSIFERKRDLKEATCRRIAHGIMRFVVNSPKPFIVPVCHSKGGNRARSGDQPLVTVTTAKGGELAICAPVLSPFFGDKPDGRVRNSNTPAEPLRTQTTENRFGLVRAKLAPHITKFRGGAIGHAAGDPLHTVTANSFIKRAGGATPLGLVTAVLVSPLFARTAHGERDRNGKKRGKGDHGPEDQYPTVLASNDSALVAVTMVGCGGRRGQSGPVDPAGPYPVITAKADSCLVAATLVKHNFGNNPAQSVAGPLHAITTQGNKFGLLSATLIQTGYGEREGQKPRILDLSLPLGTVVSGGKHGLVAAFLEKFSQNSRGKPADAPLDTAMAGAPRHAVVAAHLAQYSETRPGRALNLGHSADEPVSTIVGRGPLQALVASSLVKLRGTCRDGQPADEPLHTVSAGGLHHAEVSAFLVKYYGNEDSGHSVTKPIDTVPTKDRFGLVTVIVDGEEYVIADIGMRMLEPAELFRAQSFPPDYDIAPIGPNGKPLTKTAQVRMCGNSVCPVMGKAIAGASFPKIAAPVEQVAA